MRTASVEFAIENELDAKVALRLLEGFGVLPSGRNVVVVEEAKPEDKRTPEENHDDLVEDYLKRALRMFHVRNKVFGTPLPEVEDDIHEHESVIHTAEHRKYKNLLRQNAAHTA